MARLTTDGQRKKWFDSLIVTLEKKSNGLSRKCQAEVVLFIKPYGESAYAAYRSRPDFFNLVDISNTKCKTPDDFITKAEHLRHQADSPTLADQKPVVPSKLTSREVREASVQSFASFKSCHEEESVEPPLHVIIPSEEQSPILEVPSEDYVKDVKIPRDNSPEISEVPLQSPSFSPASPAPTFKLRRRRRLPSSPLQSPCQLSPLFKIGKYTGQRVTRSSFK